jgi:tetrahydromethanopterin S-methyltransferase subunit F
MSWSGKYEPPEERKYFEAISRGTRRRFAGITLTIVVGLAVAVLFAVVLVGAIALL